MPDLVPTILTGVMGEFWDYVPGTPHAPAQGLAMDRLRPYSLSQARFCLRCAENLDRRSCSSLEALMVLARGARGAARTWSRRLRCSTIRRQPSSRRAPRDDLPHARPTYESPAHISALEVSSILRKN